MEAQLARGAEGRLHQLRESPLGAKASIDEDADPIGQLRGLIEVVGREEDRHPLPAESAQQVVDPLPRLRIDARGGLVEEQDVGAMEGAGGEVDAALHPPGERRDAARRRDRSRPVHARARVVASSDLAAGQAGQAAQDLEVLADRQIRVERDLLGDEAEAAAQGRIEARVGPSDAHAPGVEADAPADRPDEARLPGAVRAEKGVDLATAAGKGSRRPERAGGRRSAPRR